MKKAVLTIRTIGEPCLRRVSIPMEEVGAAERLLIDAMIMTMYEQEGVGLAAPQIGVNKRIIVVDVGQGPMVFINPEIVETRGLSCMEEGCLSVPQASIKVKRPETIRVKFLNEQGDPGEMECSDLLSRVIQHECDHLDGKLIVDYADTKEKENLKELFPDVYFE